MTSVIQNWVSELPLMQQSVLLSAIRGPDGIAKYSAAKYLLRWFRRCVLLSSFDKVVIDNPFDKRGGSFTGPSVNILPIDSSDVQNVDWETAMGSVIDNYFIEFDSYPSHFTKHFMLAGEILGYKHPDTRIRKWWNTLYLRLVSDQHLCPESEEQMNLRLGDCRDSWLASSERSTIN